MKDQILSKLIDTALELHKNLPKDIRDIDDALSHGQKLGKFDGVLLAIEVIKKLEK